MRLKLKSQAHSQLIAIVENSGAWPDEVVKLAQQEILSRGGLDVIKAKVQTGDDSSVISVYERELIENARETHSLRNTIIVLAVIAFIAIVTKPSDQACIDGVKTKVESSIDASSENSITKGLVDIGTELGAQYVIRVDDYFFYKVIYLKGTGQRLGIGVFGQVLFM